jgi:hypothetical protein
MKRILKLGLGAVLALPLMNATLVMAHGAETSSVNGVAITSNESGPAVAAAETEVEKPLTDEELKAVQTRVEKRKADLKVKLTATEKLNLQNKCKASQGLVSAVKGRAKGIETSRSKVFANITTHLTDLSTKLKNRNADTKALDADIATLQTKITTFTTDLATYKQAVSDLANMDCKTDPDGFKASLLAARTALEAVNKDSQAVRSFVKDTIKPELKTIRASLEANKTEGEQ